MLVALALKPPAAVQLTGSEGAVQYPWRVTKTTTHWCTPGEMLPVDVESATCGPSALSNLAYAIQICVVVLPRNILPARTVSEGHILATKMRGGCKKNVRSHSRSTYTRQVPR